MFWVEAKQPNKFIEIQFSANVINSRGYSNFQQSFNGKVVNCCEWGPQFYQTNGKQAQQPTSSAWAYKRSN